MKLSTVIASMGLLAASNASFAYNDDCCLFYLNRTDRPILLRARAVYNVPDARSDYLGQIGGRIDNFSNNLGPELDISYFFNENVSAEFSLATTRHSVEISKSPILSDLGKVSLLMPTATVMYHFGSCNRFDPYLGAGINYTFFFDSDKGHADDIEYSESVGFVAQAGVDIYLSKNVVLNADVKKTYVDSDVKVEKAGLLDKTCLRINPWTFGVGIGWRF